MIPVFLSVGEPHNAIQTKYLKTLEKYLHRRSIVVQTIGRTFYSIEAPLIPIKQKLQNVHGAIILGMERFHSKIGIYKENSVSQQTIHNQYFTSVWAHIEAAMAYQLQLPLLILKEEKLVAEGVFDRGIHQWVIIPIHPEDPKEIECEPIIGYLKAWVKAVQDNYSSYENKRIQYTVEGVW